MREDHQDSKVSDAIHLDSRTPFPVV